VENQADEAIHNVHVSISAEPDFCQTWQTHITTIPALGTFSIPAVDVQLSASYLVALTEGVRGHLSISASVDEEVRIALAGVESVITLDKRQARSD
jgi:hypothetical protein